MEQTEIDKKVQQKTSEKEEEYSQMIEIAEDNFEMFYNGDKGKYKECWEKEKGEIREKWITDIRAEVLNEQQEKEEQQELSDIEKMWIYLAGKHSAFNETSSKYILWVLLITLLKKAGVKIHKSTGQEIVPRLSYFWLQTSRTGKDELLKFMIKIVNEVNRQYKIKYGDNLIKIRKIDGSDTVETMLTRFKTKTNKGKETITEEVLPGIFEKYDILYSPECSFILVEDRKYHKNNFGEMLLQAIEGTPMTKTLVSWNGMEATTFPNFCFIGATRPIAEHQKSIIESGLQQRGLTHVRYISAEQQKWMIDEFTQNSLVDYKFRQRIEIYIKRLANDLIEMFEQLKTKGVVYVNDTLERQKIVGMIRDYMKEKLDYCENTYPNEEHSAIGRSFVMGLEKMIIILAYKNAIVSRDWALGIKHFELAIKDLEGQIENVMEWIEGAVKPDRDKTNKEKMAYGIILQILAKKSMETGKLSKILADRMNISVSQALRLMYVLAKNGKLDNKTEYGYFMLKN